MSGYQVESHPELKRAIESTAPSVLFSGPWGSGKTRLLAEKAYQLCRSIPNYPAALVRRTRVDLWATTWKWLVEKVIPPAVLEKSTYNKSTLEIKLPNGSTIIGSGFIEGQKLASREFGFIGVEESTEISKEEDFDWIESRARDPGSPFHQVMYACNAGAPAHYLYKRFYMEKPKDPAGNPMTELIEGVTLWDLLPASYRARMSMLKGKYRERFLENKWVGYEGLVYDCFRPGGTPPHLMSRFEIPATWEYLIGIDFGFNNAFNFQMWAVSPDNKCYLEKEIYFSHRTINQHAPLIKELMEERNLIKGPKNRGSNGEMIFRQWRSFSDHDAGDAATLKEHGIFTQNAVKDVSPGIQTVYDMMDGDQVFFFDDALVEKDPILEMNKKPTCTVEELQGYIWANNTKDQPKAEDDHGCSSMRYAFHSRFKASLQQMVQQVSLGISAGPVPEWGLLTEEERKNIKKLPKEFEWINKF